MRGKIIIIIMAAFSVIGGAIVYFIGCSAWLYAIVALIVLDYITGVAAAVKESTLFSKRGFRGILRKVITLIPVALAHIVDNIVGLCGILCGVAIGFFVGDEGISLLKNTARCGIKWSQKLIDTLERLNGGSI